MTEANLAALVSVLFGLLVAVLAWIVNKAYNKLTEIGNSLSSLASALHDRITALDRRVTVVETTCTLRRESDRHDGVH